MIISTEDVEMHQARDFIAANWRAFVSHISEKGMSEDRAEAEAQRIFEAIGGEE
ncbi:TPA: hypothetical protein ACITN2_004341 [Salmonella enterica subsp. enterica serovar Virchow]